MNLSDIKPGDRLWYSTRRCYVEVHSLEGAKARVKWTITCGYGEGHEDCRWRLDGLVSPRRLYRHTLGAWQILGAIAEYAYWRRRRMRWIGMSDSETTGVSTPA